MSVGTTAREQIMRSIRDGLARSAVIEAEHLDKKFGDRVILKDANFILQRGERIGIVGPNGVGKTTFVRTILGELLERVKLV